MNFLSTWNKMWTRVETPSVPHFAFTVLPPFKLTYLCITSVKFSDELQVYLQITGAARKAVDGNRNSNFNAKSCTHTLGNTPVWWMVDLGDSLTITNVIITSRNQGGICIFSVDIQEDTYLFLQVLKAIFLILRRLHFTSVVADAGRDFSSSTIAVGPSADSSNFDPLDFPHVCANITQPFRFPETRNISCITWAHLVLLFL